MAKKKVLPDSAFERVQIARSVRDEDKNNTYLRLLLKKLPKPKRMLEVFGGVGNITKIIMEIFPGVPVESWDIDPRCVELLGVIPGVTARLGDSTELAVAKKGDGVFVDHNMLTLKTLQNDLNGMLSRILSGKPSWVQLNDSARSKLHLNFKSYGLENDLLETYMGAYDKMLLPYGYKVYSHLGHFRATQIILTPIPTS